MAAFALRLFALTSVCEKSTPPESDDDTHNTNNPIGNTITHHGNTSSSNNNNNDNDNDSSHHEERVAFEAPTQRLEISFCCSFAGRSRRMGLDPR